MADPRARVAVKLVDPTTNANEAGVTAAGELKVSLTASSATVTVDTELAAIAALADNTANPTVTSVGNFNHTFDGTNWDRQRSIINAMDTVGDGIAAAGLMAQLDDVSTGTVTENQFSTLRMSTRRALLVEGVASGTNLNVNLAASAATVTVDSELPAAAALTADAVASPTAPAVGSFMLGYNGTTWDRVRTANTGRLQVDVVSGGGSDSPTSPKTARATSSAVAAGGTATLQATQVTSGKTGKLERVICSAAVPLKVDLQTVLNGSGTTVATWFVLDNTAFTFETRHRNYISQAESATAGFDGFQVILTNQDNNTAGDVYAFFAWDEQ